MRALAGAILAVLLVSGLARPGRAAATSPWEFEPPAQEDSHPDVHRPFSRGAEDLIEQLGISATIEELQRQLLHDRLHPSDRTSIKILRLRQDLTDHVLVSMLAVQGVLAEIDQEITRSDELRSFMEARRDRAIRINSAVNFLSGGTLASIGNAVQVPPGSSNIPGNSIEVIAGALQTGLSVYALKQEGGARRTGEVRPNMLAKIFGLEPGPYADYPDLVWAFLNSPSEALPQSASRRHWLIDHWVAVERIDSPAAKGGLSRVKLLAGVVPQKRALTIDLLDDRAAMLADVRAMVAQLNRDLLDLLVGLKKL